MPRYQIVNGQRVQLTSQEETARDAEESTWAAGANARNAASAREKRNGLLAECDWLGNNDVTMPSAWTTYRSALRDVPAQGGFPNSITWPTKPS